MSDPGSVAARRFSFTPRAHRAVDEATGEAIGLEEVDHRVRWLLDLVTAAGSDLLARLWHPATFDVLAAGQDRQDRTLPVQGHVAAVRLGWVPGYPDGLVSTYRGWTYDDRGLGVKLARLQTEGQSLHRKAARLTRLAATAPPEVRARLDARIAVLDAHRTAIGAKRGRINRELAFHFARQVTDHATAAGAQVIAVEDLASLEPRGHGPVNNRAAQSARRKAVDALAHTAAGVGVSVVAVPARGSSARCPGCNAPVTRPGGYHSAWCPRCWVGGNRDHVAGVNLATRVLLGKTKITRRRGRLPAVTDAAHAPVRRCRDKTGPTPPRPRHRRVRYSQPPARARAGVKNPNTHVPAPQASVWDTVEPAPPQGDASSRETHTPHTSATSVAGSMGSMQTLWDMRASGV